MGRRYPLTPLVWTLASLLLAAALAGGRGLADRLPFRVRHVRVEGAVRTPVDQVLRAAGVRRGEALFGVDVDRVRSAVEALPWVRTARVVRQVPSTLRIRIREWEPRFLVRLDRLRYLTAEGHVVAAPLEHGLDFPVVTGFSPSDFARNTPARRILFRFLAALDRAGAPGDLAEIHYDPSEGLTVYTAAPGARALHMGTDRFAEKLRRLARLDRHLARQGRHARRVDLDYTDRIVAQLEPAPTGGTRR